jgi:hypothetical protein
MYLPPQPTATQLPLLPLYNEQNLANIRTSSQPVSRMPYRLPQIKTAFRLFSGKQSETVIILLN